MSCKPVVSTTLAARSTAYGFWLTFPSAPIAQIVLRSSSTSPVGGFSWVLIDAEHGLISDAHYFELVNAISAEGASPIIRLPWSEEWMIKRALDAGAHGVLTPMCHSAEDAKKVVQCCKYPPLGSRGYGPLYAPLTFPGLAPQAYDKSADESLVVAVQIESVSGLENVEEIARVEGLDVLLVGPFDLAKQMGVAHDTTEHETAIERILKATKAAGKTAAIFCTSGEQARARVEQGFDMVSITTDVSLLGAAMTNQLAAAKSKL